MEANNVSNGSTKDGLSSLPHEWSGLDQYQIYLTIRNHQINLPKSYQMPESYFRQKTWEGFSVTQRNKIIAQYKGLSDFEKEKILEIVRKGTGFATQKIESHNWTRDDTTRLIHLFADPAMNDIVNDMNSVSICLFFWFCDPQIADQYTCRIGCSKQFHV
jgi:hypothetical protein